MRARPTTGHAPTYSADGRRLALIEYDGRTRQVRLVDRVSGAQELRTADGAVVQVAFPRTGEPDGVAWVQERGAETELVVWRGPDRLPMPPRTAGTTELALELWTADTVWCTAAVAGTIQRALLSLDVTVGRWTEHGAVAGGLALADVTDDGTALLTLPRDGRLQGRVAVWSAGLAWPGRTVAEVGRPGEAVSAVGFHPDGAGVLVVSNVGRELRALVVVHDDLSRVLRGRDDAELESVTTTPDRRSALLVWNTAGRSSLEVVDLPTERTLFDGRVEGDVVGPVVHGADLAPDGLRVVASVTGPGLPPTVVELALSERRSRLVVAPVAPRPSARRRRSGVPPPPELVATTGSDGLPLTGWLHRPSSPTGRCVLSLHGGPDAQERPEHHPLYAALLDRGIAVLAPNVRGSRGFGASFSAADDRAGRFAARRDVVRFADLAHAEGWTGPDGLGVLGVSYGGYLAVCVLGEAPGRFSAGVTLSGVVDLAAYVSTTTGWRRPVAAAEFGDPVVDAALLASLSPYVVLPAVAAPLLVVHGRLDPVVPVGQAVDLVRRLRSTGRRARLRILPRSGHAYGTDAPAVQRMVLTWFDRRLRG